MSFDMNLKLLPVFKKIPLFKDLNTDEHEAIIKNIDTRFFTNDYVIFKEGDVADALFIIKMGKVLIYKEDKAGNREEIAVLSENNFFGEMGLVTTESRNASAQTLEDCLLFVLTKEDFQDLLANNIQMANQISETFVARYKENTKRAKS